MVVSDAVLTSAFRIVLTLNTAKPAMMAQAKHALSKDTQMAAQAGFSNS